MATAFECDRCSNFVEGYPKMEHHFREKSNGFVISIGGK